eukprot:2401361-Rhodomonas_salina.1
MQILSPFDQRLTFTFNESGSQVRTPLPCAFEIYHDHGHGLRTHHDCTTGSCGRLSPREPEASGTCPRSFKTFLAIMMAGSRLL